MNAQNQTGSARYVPTEVEPRWQKHWEESATFKMGNPGDPGFDTAKPKYYVLDMFPYPSGAGLHVGHPEGYTATDILARWRRMRGFNVLHPMGWDAFGLPAEQYAVQTGTHPAVTTQKNIDSFRDTLKRLGFSYDWSREVDTTDPKYYRWTQWIFLKLFNSIFDTTVRKARDVQEVVSELNAGKIGVKSGATLLFGVSASEAAAANLGKQWLDLSAAEQWHVLAAHRLAFVSEAPVWWCEALGTVLANEEVIDGRSERGDHPCVKKSLRQWMLRITHYADRLIEDLEGLDWPESIKAMQRHWIGRSEGAEVDFEIAGGSASGRKLRVFTTRPDTLYGATYMVLAPEHPLVKELVTSEHAASVAKYIEDASHKSDLARTDLAKDKTGVFTGAYAFNPVYEDRSNPNAKIPVWIADYVLMGYGTGAIMAVPAHDERDAEFAVKFSLPVASVVMPPDAWLKEHAKVPEKDFVVLRQRFSTDPLGFNAFFVDDGVAIKSPIIDGLPTPQAKTKTIAWLMERKAGERKITYKLRDWLFSRQRYWGEPFPIIWVDKGLARALNIDALPVTLPELTDYRPSGNAQTPLTKAQEWVNVHASIQPDGSATIVPAGTPGAVPAKRETNTMPQWAGSCWYYLRYTDALNALAPFKPDVESYWMNVDLYVGGAEHAVLHLLYSRFWHKVLYDHGVVHTREPFQKLFNQGMIQAFVFVEKTGRLIPNDDVQRNEDGTFVQDDKGFFIQKSTGDLLTQSIGKMSKGLKNVIPADDVIAEYGADTLRLYEMFMGPLDGSKPWNPRDVPGMFRFLRDCWRMIIEEDEGRQGAGIIRPNLAADRACSGEAETELEKRLHKTIKGVSLDLERMAFNTAISKLMVYKNKAMEDSSKLTRSQAERFVLMLAPFAPHIAEELWARLGHTQTLAYEKWPAFDEAMTQDATNELAVQINGKLKARVVVAADAGEEAVKAAALLAVQAELQGKTVVKVIVVPGRLVNIVIKG